MSEQFHLEELKELVRFVASALVDEPEEVDVRLDDTDRAVVVELTVAPKDLGKVIGKDGKTARALRTLVSAASTRHRKRVLLDILE